MRHRKDEKKLGRSGSHVEATLAALVCGLIRDKRIKTTVTKAKMARRAAEKLVTLARQDTLAARRRAMAQLGRRECVQELFTSIAPTFAERPGGYTRIMRLGARPGDSAEVVLLEWVDIPVPDRSRKKPAGAEAAA